MKSKKILLGIFASIALVFTSCNNIEEERARSQKTIDSLQSIVDSKNDEMNQFFETLNEGVDGKLKADALLSLYNKKTRNLSIKGAFGDFRVRAGSLIPVILNLGDMNVQTYMLVEKCKHEISNGLHSMDLTLRGGEFIA